MPKLVECEATKKQPLDAEIRQAIDNKSITIMSAAETTFDKLRGTHGNLGPGELEALAIVSDCIDRNYNEYIILSEDDPARAHAQSMGMIVVGILPLLSSANGHGILSRSEALQYLKRLGKNNFTPSEQYAQDFIDSLQ